jgi:hypothetical protein
LVLIYNSFQTNLSRLEGMAQMVERLPSNCEALSSNTVPPKKQTKKPSLLPPQVLLIRKLVSQEVPKS